MKIYAHTLVKNEEGFLWFAVTSIIDYIDKILIWDTGSTDLTAQIIKKLQDKYPTKIEFKEVGLVNRDELAALRQAMLDESDCDWIIILDGDEVWWANSIKKLIATILVSGSQLETIVTPYVNLIGDIYHCQRSWAGRYKIDGRQGHLTIRAINRKIPGLHVQNPYGKEGYFDNQGEPIQERDKSKRFFLNVPYLHFSHLARSRKKGGVIDRPKKFKYEIGERLPLDFYYPEVLFNKRPEMVALPWQRAGLNYWIKAVILEPARQVKRILLHG